MRYSIESKDRTYVKWSRFLSLAKKMGTHATKVAENWGSKYAQKLLDNAKKSTRDAVKTASERAIQKKAEAAGDLIGNKTADKITSVSKKSSTRSQNNEANDESETPKERYISPEKREQIIDELRLV